MGSWPENRYNESKLAREKPVLRVAWLSGGLAILAAFLILAVNYPNISNWAVTDRSTLPPRTYLEPKPLYLLEIMAMTFIPALSIFLFGKRWIVVEYVGWLILAFLLWGMT
jgi:hypothetical protein